MCCELRVICQENEHPWWNMILWTTSLPSTWPKVYDADVYTGVDLERRKLLYKYRGFWTYFEDEKRRYASWEMMYFIAFSFGCTSYQSQARGSRESRFSSKTIDERFRKTVFFVCWLTPENILSIVTYSLSENKVCWLALKYILLLLTFGKLTRCQ